MSNNRAFAESIIRRFDSSYRQRWEIYDSILGKLTGKNSKWLDAGAGKNEAIGEFPCLFKTGMDLYRHPELIHDKENLFVEGSLENIPFADDVFTLVSMNTVVEHIENPDKVFKEISRILVPDGHVLIHTTNKFSPLVFAGKLIPEKIRMLFFKNVFGAKEQDVFKTFHRVNSFGEIKRIENFKIEEIYFVQDLNWTNRLVFLVLFIFNLFTKIPGFYKMRTNIVVLLKKT